MKRSTFAILGFLIIATIGAVVAETGTARDLQPNAPLAASVTGTVVTSTSTSMTLRTDAGKEMVFDVDSSTTRPQGLIAGNRVTVEYKNLDGNRAQATLIATEPSTMPPETSNTYRDEASTKYRDTNMKYDDQTKYNARHEHMPRTASALPLVALVGMLSLGAGLALRKFAHLS